MPVSTSLSGLGGMARPTHGSDGQYVGGWVCGMNTWDGFNHCAIQQEPMELGTGNQIQTLVDENLQCPVEEDFDFHHHHSTAQATAAFLANRH